MGGNAQFRKSEEEEILQVNKPWNKISKAEKEEIVKAAFREIYKNKEKGRRVEATFMSDGTKSWVALTPKRKHSDNYWKNVYMTRKSLYTVNDSWLVDYDTPDDMFTYGARNIDDVIKRANRNYRANQNYKKQ